MSDTPDTWTILAMLEWATSYFRQHEVDSPRLSIEWLLADVLDIKRLDLYLAFDRPLSPAELDQLRPLIKQRANHKPLQYITGQAEFLDLTLSVTPDVLIPRPETEQLVEIILERYKNKQNVSYADIGTGSGCIPIALQYYHPSWYGHAIDVSKAALDIALDNAAKILNEAEINFLQHDIINWENLPLDDPLDFIVSNPPYVLPEEKETLAPQVRKYEPSTALYCKSYTKLYNSIIDFAQNSLSAGGTLFLEIHQDKGLELIELFHQRNQWEANLQKDYSKNDRFIIASFS